MRPYTLSHKNNTPKRNRIEIRKDSSLDLTNENRKQTLTAFPKPVLESGTNIDLEM